MWKAVNSYQYPRCSSKLQTQIYSIPTSSLMTRRMISQELLSVIMIAYIRFICFYICFYSFHYCYIIKQDMVTFKVHVILFKKVVMMLCASMKLREHQKFKLKVKTWTLVIVLRTGKNQNSDDNKIYQNAHNLPSFLSLASLLWKTLPSPLSQ